MGLVVCCMKMLSFKRVWNVTSYPKRCIVLNPSCTPSLYNSLFTINKLLASSKIQLVRGDFQFVFSKIPPTYDVLYDVLYITQSGSLALICKHNYTVCAKLRWILKNKLLFKFSTSKKSYMQIYQHIPGQSSQSPLTLYRTQTKTDPMQQMNW